MNKNTTNTAEKTAEQKKAEQKARANMQTIANEKKRLLAQYGVKAQSKLTAEQKAEFDTAIAEFIQKLTEAEQKAQRKTSEQKKDSKQKQKQTDSKKDNSKQTDSKQTDRQKAQAENKKAVVDSFTAEDIEIREDSKKNKYTLFYKLTAEKSRGVVEIFVTAKEYHICSKVKFEGSEYHDSWGFKYDNRYTDIKEVKKVVNAILKDYKAEQKKKEAEKKQKKAEDKKNEK